MWGNDLGSISLLIISWHERQKKEMQGFGRRKVFLLRGAFAGAGLASKVAVSCGLKAVLSMLAIRKRAFLFVVHISQNY
jgi:hypothetical protein